MVRLKDITVRGATSWEDARARHKWPALGAYNIATDCLSGNPGGTAIILAESGRTISREELTGLVERFAVVLHEMGIAPGDRVAMRLSQQLEAAVAVLGVLSLGAVVVPIPIVLAPESVAYRLQDSGAKLLVSEGDVDGPSVEVAVLVAGGGDTQFWRLIDNGTRGAGTASTTSAESPAILAYTSGTTGKPKGVLHGHRFLLGHNGVEYFLNFIRPDDVYYSPADWTWIGRLMLGLLVPLAHGIPVVAHRDARFDPDQVIDLIARYRVTVGLFPPTALRMIRDSGAVTAAFRESSGLRCLVSGSEAVSADVIGWAEDVLGVAVNNAFGQTEANALIGQCSALESPDRRSLGKATPGHNVELLDDDLRAVRVGDLGHIAVSVDDPVAMLGYWQNAEATGEKVRGGWLLTGDLALADENGRFYFQGRSDDLIKSGGYRIGPTEVENAILTHPAVAECAVVGLPDEVRGQVVTAFVRLHDNERPANRLIDELQECVRGRVGRHAYPRVIHFVADIPKTATGKIQRNQLRARHSPDEQID